ncbi:hypothetical protein ES703_120837 [subsurface metagenome]
MALKGEAKRVYQCKYMRGYMRKRRLVVKKMLADRFGFAVKIPRVDADGYVIPEY